MTSPRKRQLTPGKYREQPGHATGGLPNLLADRSGAPRDHRARLVRGYSYRIPYKDQTLAFEDDGSWVEVTKSEAEHLASIHDKTTVTDSGRRTVNRVPKFEVTDGEGNPVQRPRQRQREAPVTGQDAYERSLRRREILQRRRAREAEADLLAADEA